MVINSFIFSVFSLANGMHLIGVNTREYSVVEWGATRKS